MILETVPFDDTLTLILCDAERFLFSEDDQHMGLWYGDETATYTSHDLAHIHTVPARLHALSAGLVYGALFVDNVVHMVTLPDLAVVQTLDLPSWIKDERVPDYWDTLKLESARFAEGELRIKVNPTYGWDEEDNRWERQIKGEARAYGAIPIPGVPIDEDAQPRRSLSPYYPQVKVQRTGEVEIATGSDTRRAQITYFTDTFRDPRIVSRGWNVFNELKTLLAVQIDPVQSIR